MAHSHHQCCWGKSHTFHLPVFHFNPCDNPYPSILLKSPETFLKKQTHQKVFQFFVFKTEVFINYMNFIHPHQLRICSRETTGKHQKISGFLIYIPMYQWSRENRSYTCFPAVILLNTVFKWYIPCTDTIKSHFSTGRPCTVSLPDVVLLWYVFSS